METCWSQGNRFRGVIVKNYQSGRELCYTISQVVSSLMISDVIPYLDCLSLQNALRYLFW